jgi:hypothetical protein
LLLMLSLSVMMATLIGIISRITFICKVAELFEPVTFDH